MLETELETQNESVRQLFTITCKACGQHARICFSAGVALVIECTNCNAGLEVESL